MFRLKARVTAVRRSATVLAVQTSAGRRVLFGVSAVFLVVAFLVGADWERDFQNGIAAGMVFYTGLTLICVAVAGWKSRVLLDTESRTVVFSKLLFGMRVQEAHLRIDDVTCVVVHGIRFLKDAERPQPGLLNNRLRETISRRNVYYKLFLETSGKRHLIDDSTDASELDSAATAIGAFLNVPVRHEEH